MLNNLSIRARLLAGFAILIGLLLVTNLLALQKMAGIMGDMNSLVDDRVVKVNEANHIMESALANGRALRSLLLMDSTAEREKIKAEVAHHRQENNELLGKLESQLYSDDAKTLLAKIKEKRAALQDWYPKYFEAAERNPGEAKQILFKEFIPRNDAFVATLKEMVELQEKHMRDEVTHDRDSYSQARTLTIGLLIGGIILGLAAAFWIIASIAGPLQAMRDVITQVRNNSDFTQTVTVSNNDEVGQTAHAFNELLGTMRQTLQHLKTSINQVAGAAEGLASTSGQSARASASTSESASSMAASVEQVSVSINHVSENARSASELAQRGGQLSDEGGLVIGNTVEEMHHIGDAIEQVAHAITRLGEQSDKISGVIQVIKDVADQTNLLALNAAIEAARAGEAGRGFAVVADEVRKLAERTTTATGEIAEMVTNIQNSSQSAVEAMHNTVSQVETGRELAAQAGKSIKEIREAVSQVVGVVADIADSIAEQSTASQSIAQQLEQVAQAAEENNAASDETAVSAQQLGRLAAEMRATTERFRI